MYLVYALLNLLVSWGDVLADIIYWIMLFFAPFSLLDCFIKIAARNLLNDAFDVTDPGINFKLPCFVSAKKKPNCIFHIQGIFFILAQMELAQTLC